MIPHFYYSQTSKDNRIEWTYIFNFIDSGITIGRKDKDNGQIGEIKIQGTSLCTIGPPTDKLQAVDPVGVETINPSFIILNYNLLSFEWQKYR